METQKTTKNLETRQFEEIMEEEENPKFKLKKRVRENRECYGSKEFT